VGLTLGRRQGEAITLPGSVPAEDVVIRVVGIDYSDDGVPKVRIDITAPPEQDIWRSEVWRRIERKEAADVRPRDTKHGG
jgi:sRNA-binding carbon storage regulator CsrA